MYIPPHFSITALAELERIITTNPLGILVTSGQGLAANHLPFLFDAQRGEHGTLLAHVARANPVWQTGSDSPAAREVLVIFAGVQGYISPNWYPSKQETQRQVPTWNYEAVHARGIMTVHDDEKFVRSVVGRLTRLHEAAEPEPWRMSDTEPGYLAGMLRNIVGLEITVTELRGKAKLSQNKEVRDRHGAVDALQARGGTDLAEAMRRA